MGSLIKKILLEEVKKTEWEYQVRDIGGSDVFYKRKKGNKKWSFTGEAEFYKNSNKNNTVKWVEKKPKKGSKVKQVDVPQEKGDRLDYLYVYYQNLTSNDCKVEKKDNSIVITVK